MTTRSIYFDPPPPAEPEKPLAIPAHSSPQQHTGSKRPGLGGWDDRRRTQSRGQLVVMKVSGCNRGGLLLEDGADTGLVSASQLLDFPEAPNPARWLGLSLGESSEF